jgi:AcrR family transcriptional regulator
VAEAAEPIDLLPRAHPVQQRARETLEKILDVAAEILEEGGADALTTRALAERADVRIRSVYRYFPNKLAIIHALAERIARRQREILQVATRRSAPGTPWRTALRREIGALVDSFDAEPGLAAVRRAMQVCPALREVDARASEEIAQRWEEDLRAHGMRGSRAHRLRVARTAVAISVALLDPIQQRRAGDRAADLRELGLVLESYLANHLDPPGR